MIQIQDGKRGLAYGRLPYEAIALPPKVLWPTLPARVEEGDDIAGVRDRSLGSVGLVQVAARGSTRPDSRERSHRRASVVRHVRCGKWPTEEPGAFRSTRSAPGPFLDGA